MQIDSQSKIFDYIEAFYSQARRHTHLSGVSPEKFDITSK
jgi:putative transposase